MKNRLLDSICCCAALFVLFSSGGLASAQTSLNNGQEVLSSFLTGGSRTFTIQVNTVGMLRFSVGETGAGLPAEPQLQVFDPNNNLVGSDFGNTGSSEALVQVETTITGTYTAVVTDRDGDESLNFRIRVVTLPGSPQLINGRDRALVNGEELITSIPLGTFAIYPIQVDATGTLRVSVGEMGNLLAEPNIQLFDPAGVLVASDFGNTNSSDALVQVETDQVGVYTAIVYDRDNNAPLDFRVRVFALPGQAQLINGRDGALANGEELIASIPLGTFAMYPIQVDATGTLRVSVGEMGSLLAEPNIQLFDPAGALVASDFGNTNTSDALVQVETDQVGTYTAIVYDRDNNAPLDFRVRVFALPGQPQLINGRDAALANGEEWITSIPLGTFAMYPIQVDATGTLRVSVGEMGSLLAEPNIQLFDPAGVLVASDFGNTNSSDALVQVETDQIGTYTAIVYDRDNNAPLDFRVRVFVLPGQPQLINGRDVALANGEEVNSSIPLGSFAMYPIDVDSLGELIVSVGETGAGLPAQPNIQLFDPAGALVASDFGGTSNSDAVVQVATDLVGTYTAVVYDKDNDQAMEFRVRALAIPGAGQLIGGRDESIVSGVTFGSSFPLGTFAWFPLNVNSAGTVSVSVVETGAGLPAEPVIQLFDPNGNLVDSDFGNTGSSDAFVQFATGQAGTFVAVVSERSNDEPLEFDILATFPSILTGESVTPTRGQYVAGGIVELESSDNSDYAMRRSSSDIQSRTEFVIKATSPIAMPTTMDVTLEGSVFARSPVIQTIELFDYDSQSWELVDSRTAQRFNDSTVQVAASGDVSRFVEPGTQCVEARIRYRSQNPRQQFSSNTDQFFWVIE